jgi:hypothetical protein
MPEEREMLRHTLATVAYRAAKALRGAPETFAGFEAFPSTRTPAQILAHMGDLMDWALAMASGAPKWNNSTPLPWNDEIDRFFSSLTSFDRYLASDAPLGVGWDKLFQGPIADSLNHIGQLNMLRRMAGTPVRGESYNRAAIEVGRTGYDQAPADPRFEFE